MIKRSRALIFFLIGLLLLIAVTLIPLPYYITKPGLTEKLGPYVKVDGGYKENGDFMLVTISMTQATVLNYTLAKLNKYDEVYKKEEIYGENESDQEYQFRQTLLMNESQNAAIYNAYKKANKTVQLENNGVLVVEIAKDMPAFGRLETGDRLIGMDGKSLTSAEEFIQNMSAKKSGDKVQIEFERSGIIQTATFTLQPIKDGTNRAGIGVRITTDQKVKVNPDVKINSNRIGGPSAGLMFTLEIYNQLTEDDLTKGHEIAGTGTINTNGEVGPIGGIKQKVVAANDAGAEIFFAPNEKGNPHSNFSDAVATAKDIHSKMKIVPVDTVDDALNYLKNEPLVPSKK